jgi:GntR family transcriptional regulator
MLSLDHQSSIPLRAQVESLLRELVRGPDYQKSALLPNEITLAAQLGVSRGTIRSGISKLVFEGVLERKAGVGTRLSNRQFESGIRAWHSFSREMASKGIIVQNFRTSYCLKKVCAAATVALQLKGDEMVWCLDRVRGWDDKPVLQSISWFHPRLRLNGNEDVSQPLYEMIEKNTGTRPCRARDEFLAENANVHMARVLEVDENSPLLLRQHTAFDPGGRPFEFAEVRYVSSRFTLTLDMRRGEP